MHQLINKKKIYFYILCFLFLSTILNYNLTNNLKNKFKILDIKIETKNDQINELILNNTKFLINENILFINKKILQENLFKLSFLDTIRVKKKYPSTIKIIARKTELIAITFIDQKKYYVGSNGNFILTTIISNTKSLPTIFGKFDVNDFISLKKKLIELRINDDEILKYYYHKNKRWDLYLKNNILIQLPDKNISNAIKLYNQFKIKNRIYPDTIIDLRIKNRLIINNE